MADKEDSKYVKRVPGATVPASRVLEDDDGTVMFWGEHAATGNINGLAFQITNVIGGGTEITFVDDDGKHVGRYVFEVRGMIEAAYKAHKENLPNE